MNKTHNNQHHKGMSHAARLITPSTARRLSTHQSRTTPPIVKLPSLDGHWLRDVVNDTKSRAFCGPTTVAAITGMPVSIVRDCYRLVQHGAKWVEWPRAPRVAGTYWHQTEKVLRLLGYVGTWHQIAGKPTFASFMNARTGAMRTYPCAVFVTRHVVAVSGWQFCDTFSKGVVVDAETAPRRRARVKRVFVITDRVPPSEIPRKDYSASKSGMQRSMNTPNFAAVR